MAWFWTVFLEKCSKPLMVAIITFPQLFFAIRNLVLAIFRDREYYIMSKDTSYNRKNIRFSSQSRVNWLYIPSVGNKVGAGGSASLWKMKNKRRKYYLYPNDKYKEPKVTYCFSICFTYSISRMILDIESGQRNCIYSSLLKQLFSTHISLNSLDSFLMKKS